MFPVYFPEANKFFGAPEGMEESQVGTIHACLGTVEGGNLDGVPVLVTCWQPTAEEIGDIWQGKPVYITFIGTGLLPHKLETQFPPEVKYQH